MRSHYAYIILLFIWMTPLLRAQSPSESIRGRLVDPSRYDNIKGSPFLFDHWVYVTIIPSSGTSIEHVPINFNGFTQNFESLVNGKIVEVELGYFIGMTLEQADSTCGKQSFLKFFHEKLVNKYPLFVFNGRKHRLIKDFQVTQVQNKVETPGKTERFTSFKTTSSYFLLKGAELQPIKLNLKDILQVLAHPDLEKYIQENQIDVSTEAGLCQALAWLEEKH